MTSIKIDNKSIEDSMILLGAMQKAVNEAKRYSNETEKSGGWKSWQHHAAVYWALESAIDLFLGRDHMTNLERSSEWLEKAGIEIENQRLRCANDR